MSHIFTVSKNEPCDFKTINEALVVINELDEHEEVTLKLLPGVYEEVVEIKKPYLTIIGENPETTIISFNNSAFMDMGDGMKRGTFRSYTVFIDTHDFTAENITIRNNAGFGKEVGQSIALYADGDHLIFRNCHMLSSQDTIFTGPLPPKELQPNGFIGPKQFAPRINGHQYYDHCFIRGDIDFIFGSATAYFDHCELFSQDMKRDAKGYVTAPSTPEGQEYGYVFESCRFTGDAPKGSVYLGRPWRNYAKSVFLNCELGEHINPAGFHDWNKPDTHENSFCAEYGNLGPGAKGPRESWVHVLSSTEIEKYDRKKVLGF